MKGYPINEFKNSLFVYIIFKFMLVIILLSIGVIFFLKINLILMVFFKLLLLDLAFHEHVSDIQSHCV